VLIPTGILSGRITLTAMEGSELTADRNVAKARCASSLSAFVIMCFARSGLADLQL